MLRLNRQFYFVLNFKEKGLINYCALSVLLITEFKDDINELLSNLENLSHDSLNIMNLASLIVQVIMSKNLIP